MAPSRVQRSVRTAVVWDLLSAALAERSTATGRRSLTVLDAGGGTGSFAVPLAELGHRVTVVDPSPDALAALARRVAEAGVQDRVTGTQGDAGDLPGLVEPGSADAVLCHDVLEVVEDPAAALAAAVGCLAPGGVLSLLAANRDASVLAKALTGHLAEARHALADPAGRWGPADPVPRRFCVEELRGLLRGAGAPVVDLHGIRIFSDLVPGALLDEPGAVAELLALETAAAAHPGFLAVATQFHLLGRRG